MKKIQSSLLTLIIFLSFNNFTQAATGATTSTNEINWELENFENAKKLEFILSLKDSVLLQSLKSDPTRLSKGKNGTYKIINIRSSEEKLAMKITNLNGESIIFTNFDSSSESSTKRFHDVSLVKHNGQLKAKVTIYVHKDLDEEVAKIILDKNDINGNPFISDSFKASEAKNRIKNIAYLYIGYKNGKITTKAKLLKIK